LDTRKGGNVPRDSVTGALKFHPIDEDLSLGAPDAPRPLKRKIAP
jgi:hypothetical protein